jgi:hypothetical protein
VPRYEMWVEFPPIEPGRLEALHERADSIFRRGSHDGAGIDEYRGHGVLSEPGDWLWWVIIEALDEYVPKLADGSYRYDKDYEIQ